MVRAPGGAGNKGESEILLEFRQIGNSVKVTAVDTATLTGISIVGAASASEDTLKRTVVSKLKYVLEKQRGGRKGGR